MCYMVGISLCEYVTLVRDHGPSRYVIRSQNFNFSFLLWKNLSVEQSRVVRLVENRIFHRLDFERSPLINARIFFDQSSSPYGDKKKKKIN